MKSTIHEHQKNNFKIVSKNLLLGMMVLVVSLSTQAQKKRIKTLNILLLLMVIANNAKEESRKRLSRLME